MAPQGRIKVIPCGTRQGYRAHRHHGEPVCEPCRKANAEYALAIRNADPEKDRRRQRERLAALRRLNPPETPDERFARKWVVGEPPAERPDLGPCHIWTAFRDSDGYGRFWFAGDNMPAHRYAIMRSGREIPPTYEPDHLCRNTSCVNQAHLEVVTKVENLARRGKWVGVSI